MLFSLQDTKDVLKKNTVSNTNALLSFLVLMIMFGLGCIVTDTLSLVIDVLILCLGTYYAMLVNNSGDGKNFLERYIIMSCAVQIRMLIAVLAIAVLGGILLGILHAFIPEAQLLSQKEMIMQYAFIFNVALEIFLEGSIYFFIGRALHEVAHHNASN